MAPLMATALGFILLTANSIIAIHKSWGHDDAAAMVFVIASYASLVLLFCFLRLFETAPMCSPPVRERARRGMWPLTTVLTLPLGVVNCDMAIAIHKAGSDPGSATCVLVSYGALLALVWLLVREFAVAH